MRSNFVKIVQFNWPFYAAAVATAIGVPSIAARLALIWPIRAVMYAGTVLVVMWIVASVAASWIVYDWSRLMEWDWMLQALGFSPKSWINLHAGYDPSTPALRKVFKDADGRVFDIFDPKEMTEPSIRQARRLARNAVAADAVDFHHLPVPTGTIDVATLLLSAHELRSEQARSALFTELRRILGPGGRVVVAEHLRDWANFLAFGPGCFHFHSRRTWTRCFSRHRFDIHREFSITPFVRVFVLRRLT
ncbi:MAG TPA: methyltransferase domain-containing protein [Vicinamibacterales bacterium]